jgi:hypothetical protein
MSIEGLVAPVVRSSDRYAAMSLVINLAEAPSFVDDGAILATKFRWRARTGRLARWSKQGIPRPDMMLED